MLTRGTRCSSRMVAETLGSLVAADGVSFERAG